MIDYTIRSNRLGFDRNYPFMLEFTDIHGLTDSIYVLLMCSEHQHSFAVDQSRQTLFCDDVDQRCLYLYVQEEYGHTPTTTPLVSPTGGSSSRFLRSTGTGTGVVKTPFSW